MFPTGSENRPRHGAPMPEDSRMKTVFAPDTAAAWQEAARDLALAYPVSTFALCAALTALFAAWAARQF